MMQLKKIMLSGVVFLGILFNLPNVYSAHIERPFRILEASKNIFRNWETINTIINKNGIIQTGKGINVAIIDSGIYPHKDLTGKLGDQVDYTNPFLSVSQAHGTFVAGIVSRMAPGATLTNYRVLQRGIRSIDNVCYAVKKAVDNNVDVINMSLGVDNRYSNYFKDKINELEEAIGYAQSKGILVIAAAGNNGDEGNCSVGYPAGFKNVLSVGASWGTTDNIAVASFSSKGPRNNYLSKSPFDNLRDLFQPKEGDFEIKPDLIAPGYKIISLRPSKYLGYFSDAFNYMPASGTSAAAPFVAGAAALLKEANPYLSNDELTVVLCNYASPLHTPTGNSVSANTQGAGLLNIKGAIEGRTAISPHKLIFRYSPIQKTILQNKIMVEKTITIKNRDTIPRDYLITVDGDYKKGISFNLPDSITVGAGEEKTVSLKAAIDCNDYNEEFKRLGNTHPTGRYYFTCGKEKINIPFSIVGKAPEKQKSQKTWKDRLSKASKWVTCHSASNTDALEKE